MILLENYYYLYKRVNQHTIFLSFTKKTAVDLVTKLTKPDYLPIFCPPLQLIICLSFVYLYTWAFAYLVSTLHLSICLSFAQPYTWASAHLLSTPTLKHLPIFCPPYTWASAYLLSTQHLSICLSFVHP